MPTPSMGQTFTDPPDPPLAGNIAYRTPQEMADAGEAAFFEAMLGITKAHPKGRTVFGRNGTVLVITGALMSPLNGVFCRSAPDPTEIDRLAALIAGEGLPWSISVRGEPPAGVLDVAARYGRDHRAVKPLMVCRRDHARLRGPRDEAPTIRTITSSEAEAYSDLLDVSFTVPTGVFGSLMAGPLLDAPWSTTYVAELGGVPVATGYGIRTGDHIGVFNIAVLPEFRSRGYGRLMTQRVMQDGFDAGATSAYLQPSADGFPLYESMGFRTVASRSYLS